ncbi:AAA family ATPase [Mucilaginibacter aquaedulcis]|uniref:AAA family ATPase n=1 Tax=Mucilaginibacter aquaedulcis TaxID=1187081 RepID=UPI0025B5DBB5|nr:AAA family ATPase [Mucilaginibacter aquaedulcis]MDN3547058.1 AAA family ATPase [Mucilaginibacter aquaedulcis]
MKILIMGASCAGSTTLGAALAKQLGYVVFDSDEYFWEKSVVPFTVKRNPELRNNMMISDTAKHDNWILSGSMVSWGEVWLHTFDLVVFLCIPHDIRMQRLHTRELERYGDLIFTDPVRAKNYQDFVQWASGYDDNTTNGRTLQIHEAWLSKVSCPILEIWGDTTVEERVDLVLKRIEVV